MSYRSLVLAGSAYNYVTVSTLFSVTSENVNFPKAFLYDKRMANPFRYNADAADVSIIFDLGSARSVDFLGIFGHNLTAGITSVLLQHSDIGTGGAWTTNMSCDHEQPTFYMYRGAGSTSHRFWKVVFIGTNGSPIWIGELVLGLASVLTKNPNYPVRVVPMEAHISTGLPTGDSQETARMTAPPRRLDMAFQGSPTQERAAYATIFTASRGSLYSAVFVPQADDAYTGAAKQTLQDDQHVVILGRLDKDWPAEQGALRSVTWRVGAMEQAYPQPLV